MSNIGRLSSEELDVDVSWNWDNVTGIARIGEKVALSLVDSEPIVLPCPSTEEAKKLYNIWLEAFIKHCGYDSE